MKKSIIFLGVAFCSVLFVLSCNKEENSLVEESVSPVKATRTVTFEFPTDPDTRVSIAANGKTAWTPGDEIFIHGAKVGQSGDTYYSRIVTLSSKNISNDGKRATFELEDIDADAGWGRSGYGATLFAVYPASAVSSYSDGAWWYYTTPIVNTNTLILAGTNNKNAGEEDKFTFKILSGVLSFVISEGSYDSYVFSGNGGTETVSYDVFSCRIDTQNTFGDKNVIPYNGGSGGIGTSGANTTVSGDLAANGVNNFIYFPGGVNLSSGFTIKFIKDGNIVKTLSTSTSKNIGMGEYLNLGDVTTSLKEYSAPTSHDAATPAITGAVDLSATASANCYIVDGSDSGNAGKVFKFKAYQGKSTDNVGVISSVEILWETWNNNDTVTPNSVIAEVDYDKQAGNSYYEICFKMPDTLHPGNAVIAARNSGGVILWSWHIWVPSTEITSADYGIYKTGKVMQDRNLGALTVAVASNSNNIDVTSVGLVYQWGRKDPFLALDTISEGSYRSWATYTGTASFVSVEENLSLDDATHNPTKYAKGTNTNHNWLSPYNTTLWGDGGSKAKYDPCPPGYRVPLHDTNCYLFGDNGGSYDITSAPGWGYDNTHYWFKLGDPVTVFPCAGYRNGGDWSFKSTFRTIIWDAHLSSYQGSNDEPYYSAYNRRIEWESSAIKIRNDSQYNYIGGSVRCVAE